MVEAGKMPYVYVPCASLNFAKFVSGPNEKLLIC